jgi:hypothetical protein
MCRDEEGHRGKALRQLLPLVSNQKSLILLASFTSQSPLWIIQSWRRHLCAKTRVMKLYWLFLQLLTRFRSVPKLFLPLLGIRLFKVAPSRTLRSLTIKSARLKLCKHQKMPPQSKKVCLPFQGEATAEATLPNFNILCKPQTSQHRLKLIP